MKIALLTIHNANNYGAILQTFAMQEVLKRYGEVEIINYRNRHISRSFDLIRLKPDLHGLLGFGKDILRLKPRYKVIKKFRKFIAQSLILTDEVSSLDLANGACGIYDVYVAGSDQIWNPNCVNASGRLDTTYFLDFVGPVSKKISYASSMGGYIYNEIEEGLARGFLKTFEKVSVREKSTQRYLAHLIQSEVEHVLDPSLLLNKEEWINQISDAEGSQLNEPYILLYTVPKVDLVRKAVSFFSKKLGLKVIAIDQGLWAGAKVDQLIRDAGPEDFLRLFANAKFVITDSFHGTCFALNFEKPFVAISPGKHSNRVESLLNEVGAKNRLVNVESDLLRIPDEIDYTKVSLKLELKRKQAFNYLSNSL